jgi:hypothetical protein
MSCSICFSSTRPSRCGNAAHAGTAWQDNGWMFTQPNGRPISPEQDRRDWLALLENSGVRTRPAARRPTHRRHRPAPTRHPRTRRHGIHGLVPQLDGQALPARHCGTPQRYRPAAQRVLVGCLTHIDTLTVRNLNGERRTTSTRASESTTSDSGLQQEDQSFPYSSSSAGSSSMAEKVSEMPA